VEIPQFLLALRLPLLNVLYLKLKHLNKSKILILNNINLKIKNLFFLVLVSIIISMFLIKLIFYEVYISLRLSKYINLIKKINKKIFKIILLILLRYSLSLVLIIYITPLLLIVSDFIVPTVVLAVLPFLPTIFEEDEVFKNLLEEDQPSPKKKKKLKINLNKDLPSLPLDEDELNTPSRRPTTCYTKYNSGYIQDHPNNSEDITNKRSPEYQKSIGIHHKDYILDWSKEVALTSTPSKPIPYVDETNLNLLRTLKPNESGWIKYSDPVFPLYSNRLTNASLYENYLRNAYGIRDDNLIIKENLIKKIKKFFINLFSKNNNDFNNSQ
jgi:hypothetical protein